jgi:endonuclease/exonuclease/phosphatase family metal-dependent hydrolase
MKMMIGFLLLCLVGLFLLIAWCSYPWSINQAVSGPPLLIVEPVDMMDLPEHPTVLKILSFNLGFLYGQGSEGPGYEFRNRSYYQDALLKLAKELKEWDADIVCLQEIDFESARSHDINQAEYLAIHAGYPYMALASSWEAQYIPFPYWPLYNNFGHMRSGGAILSRYPLSEHEVILLKKPQSQPWWYNLFYLHRYFQRVTVEVGQKKFKLINLHLEAFDKNDRREQAEKLVEKIKTEDIDFVAGDFNTLPSRATKIKNFPNGDDYENDMSYGILQKSGLDEVVPEDIYAKDESLFFTFPAWKPDRRLDYIWFKRELKMMKAEVLSSASSDHLPLRASFQIDSPKFNPYSL